MSAGDVAVSRALRPQEELWMRQVAMGDGEQSEKDVEERVAAMRSRVLAGEPLQYVLGHWQFRKIELDVGPGVLIPRFETEIIVDLVIKALATRSVGDQAPRVADLGTGSGAIALAVAQEIPGVQVVATDISSVALAFGARNASKNHLSGRIEWREGSWVDALGGYEPFDVVVTNPPYVSVSEWEVLDELVRDWEPQEALIAGEDGLAALRVVTARAGSVLKPGGTLVTEIGSGQAAVVSELFLAAGFCEIEVVKDLALRDRFVMGCTHARL